MLMRNSAVAILALIASTTDAFVGPTANRQTRCSSSQLTMSSLTTDSMDAAIRRELNYIPGGADTEFARRFKHLVGAKVKTVGEAFAEFNQELGYTVNPLYKNMVTDLVGTTHLVIVSPRFKRDAIWSLGIITALNLLLKNYPEPDVAAKIISSLFKCVGLDEAEVRADAARLDEWSKGKTRAELEAALMGEGDSEIAQIVRNNIKNDEWWQYSRYFGIGLLKVMENIGLEMDKDEVYPIMEDWMQNKIGRSPLTACNDSDLYFKIKEKLDMMETMMKEIEIREKKRMAERLEARAEAALRAVEKEGKFQAEIEAEALSKSLDRVEA